MKWAFCKTSILVLVILSFVIFIIVSLTAHLAHPRLTREEFLYDFDYLVTVLEENFPSLGIIYNRNGVDLPKIAQRLRSQLTDGSVSIDFVSFWSMLRDDFFDPAWPVGHLWLVSDAERRWLISEYEGSTTWGAVPHFWPILNNPPSHPSYSRLLASTRMRPLPTGANLTTRILEEHIAYLRVNLLPGGTISPTDRQILINFYQSIADFEHLVIDMRGNPGGSQYYFHVNIAAPLITEPLHARFYHFFKGGDHTVAFMQTAFASQGRSTVLQAQPVEFSINEASTIFENEFDLDHINDYLSRMCYYFVEIISVHPSWADIVSPFNGKIWMLIDGGMTSASQVIASFYKEVGFATLVGETTAGSVASPWHSNYFTLPNTGIIIRYDPTLVLDSRGRPLEYGTEPHHFNRPGLDALQTVLELIYEGNYLTLTNAAHDVNNTHHIRKIP